MNTPAVASIIMGIVIIAARGPMMFAPRAVIEFFKRGVLSSNARIRYMGLVVSSFGAGMILAAWGHSQITAYVIWISGWIVTPVSVVFLLVFPSTYKKVAAVVFGFNIAFFRVLGFVGVAMGVGFIYLGVIAFGK